MADLELRQSSMAGGVIGDHALGRADLAKYQVGVRTGNNVIALPHGPLVNRPGTKFLMHSRYINWPYAQTDADEDEFSKVKLIPFEYAENDTYMLGFGHKHMRVFRNGAPVLESVSNAINDISQADPAVLEVVAADHGWAHMDLVYVDGAGGMTNFNNRYWYISNYEQQEVVEEVSAADPAVVTITGHPYSNDDIVYIDDVVDGVGTTGTLVNKSTYMIKNAGADDFELYDAATGLVTKDTSGSAAIGTGGFCMSKVAAYGTNQFALLDLWGNAVDSSDPAFDAYTSGGNVYRVMEKRRHRMLDEADIEYTLDHVQRLHVAQSADVMPMAHRSYAPRELKRNDHDDWDFESISFVPLIETPENLAAPTVPVSGADLVTWYVTATAEETGEESAAATIETRHPIYPNGVVLTWDAVTGAKYYNVYRTDETFRRAGFVGLVESPTPSFVDPGEGGIVEPDFTIGPPFGESPFGADGETNNPGVVTYYEQRLHWASTVAKPQQVWSSVAGVYYNMNGSVPLFPDDALSWIVSSQKENGIMNLIPLDALIVATTAKQYKVTGANGGPITAEAGGVEPRPGGHFGSSWLQALTVGDGALYVTGSGPKVRDAMYDFATNSYKGGELSILANHFFGGYSIVDWCYAESPWSIALIVRSDGKVICFTYHKEHDVHAWTLLDFGGQVESIAAVREGNEHFVYMVVRRVIDGNVVRYYERMNSRDFRNFDAEWDVRNAYFVDCGASYDVPFPATPQLEDATYYVDETNGRFYLDNSDGTFNADGGTWPGAPDWDGDYVDIDDFQGDEAITVAAADRVSSINGYQFYVTAATATYIEIAMVEDVDTYEDIDAAYMADWSVSRYGSVRRCITGADTGLWHLEGETVAILANGSVGEPQVITGGAFTLPDDVSPASRIHVGLPIPEVDIEFLDAENQDGTHPIGHLPQSLDSATILVRHSRGIWWGPDVDNLGPRGERTDERYTEPIRMQNRMVTTRNLPLTGAYDHSRLYIRQPNPLPLEVMAIIRGISLDRPS